MAIFQCGNVKYIIKKWSITKDDFQTFINGLNLNDSYSIIMDNASIHKNINLTSNVNIIYTPPYGCEYQPIELLFFSS